MSSVVSPLFHANVYGAVPPEVVTSIAPFEPPAHVTEVTFEVMLILLILFRLNVAESEHPFASVTVTVYVPAAIPARSSVVSPDDHENVNGGNSPETDKSIPPSVPPH